MYFKATPVLSIRSHVGCHVALQALFNDGNDIDRTYLQLKNSIAATNKRTYEMCFFQYFCYILLLFLYYKIITYILCQFSSDR